MKKPILIFFQIFFLLLVSESLFSQTGQPAPTPSVPVLSPNGIFDVLYDSEGNAYSLANLDIHSGRAIGGPYTVSAVPVLTCSSGYFNLYFAPGSVWTTSVPMQTLICQLFADISGFINSPITNTLVNPTNFKINIYCDQSSGIAGLASPFFLFPNNATNTNQGLIDATIYKAITSGVDPYMNIPITFSNSGNFYHGLVAINPALSWWTDISQLAAGGYIDLYSVMLHEITHSLGFMTLIDESGNSFLGQNNNYYSRYDKFLVDYLGNPLLSNPSSTVCSNSNLAFTAPLSAIKPSLCTNTAAPAVQADVTTCSLAVKYVSSAQTVTVYTPNCFETGASLSHFEDMCASLPIGSACYSANANSNNNLYYAMANRFPINLSPCSTKRFLKPEEKQVLCDLGYSVNSTYSCSYASITSTSATYAYIDAGFNFYGYASSCSPTNIIGLNDGLISGAYIYTTTGTSISIPTASILANDSPTTGLSVSCEEIVYTNTITNAAAAVSGTNLVVSAAAGSGLVLVKYLPKNSANQYGNATYVYVYFLSNNCNPINSCNIVQNGGFENLINSTVTPQCGLLGTDLIPNAISCWESYEGIPSVISRSCSSSGGTYDLGNNTIGSSPIIINSFNGTGNDRIIGLSYTNSFPFTSQSVKNNLGTPLVPLTSYKLSFMVNNPASTINIGSSPVVISVATNTTFAFPQTNPFPSGLNTISDFTIPVTSGWTQVTYTFTFISPGSVNQSALLIGINGAKTSIPNLTSIWCYIDEVSLVALPSPSFAITSNTICGNQTISDLGQYASISGVFSGNGVTLNNGLYNFNLNSTLSPGTYPIAFTYTNGGCINTLYELITVKTNTNYVFLNPANLCMSSPTINLNSLITNTAFIGSGVFSINNSTTNPSVTFSTTGISIVTYSYTSGSFSMCTNLSNTTAVTVYSVPTTPSIFNGTTSVSTTDLCIGNVFSVSATGSGSIFTWQPGNFNGSSQNLSPTVTTIYTLSAYNHSSCAGTATLAINVFTNCCNSVIIPALTLTSVSSAFAPNPPLLISHDFTVQSGGYFVLTGDYYFTGNGKITIANQGDVHISGAHLHACENDMWQGIVVKDGGHISANNGGSNDNLIEDAITAIDVSNNTTSTLNPIIEIFNTTFNKNYVDINLSNYPLSSTTYSNPFWINGCVFSCRNFTFNSVSWPQTGLSGSGLRSAGNPTTGLAAPYQLQGVSIANLKNPYSNQTSHVAIQINSVGVNNSSGSFGAIIGDNANNAYFNLFDAHGRFISASNSNVTSLNNVFQNTQTYTVSGGSTFGGSAIYHNTSSLMNTALTLTGSTSDVGNRFWDCHRAVEGNNTYLFWMEKSIVRSNQNSSNYTSSAFLPGNTGLFMTTNRFDYYIANNEFTNLQNAIYAPVTVGVFSLVPTCSVCPSTMNGVYAHRFRVSQNVFSAGTGTNTYMDNAVKVAGMNTVPWFVPTVSVTPFIQAVSVKNNTLTEVFRGISVANNTGYQTDLSENTITLKEDNLMSLPQHAITLVNSNPTASATIGKNIISSNTASYSASSAVTNTNASLIFCGTNGTGLASPSVACNNLSQAYQGFVFDNSNAGTVWAGNSMKLPMSRGFVLDHAGVIGVQGGTSTAISNQWTGGTWSGTSYGTFVNASCTAVPSKLYVRGSGTALPPNAIGNVLPALWFTALSGNILVNNTGADYNCAGIPNAKVVTLPNGNNYSSVDQFYMAKMALYRFLHFNDSVRTANGTMGSFYSAQSSNSIGKFVLVEESFYLGDISGGATLNSSISTTNTVEANYKNYYAKYAAYALNDFKPISAQDDAELLALANLCPGTDGACIYQARELYNFVLKKIVNYNACDIPSSDRVANIQSSGLLKKSWDVELFPNPATNQITIVGKNQSETLNIVIKDLSNRVVLTKVLETNDFIANLDLNLINGLYFVSISSTNHENITKKLLIEK